MWEEIVDRGDWFPLLSTTQVWPTSCPSRSPGKGQHPDLQSGSTAGPHSNAHGCVSAGLYMSVLFYPKCWGNLNLYKVLLSITTELTIYKNFCPSSNGSEDFQWNILRGDAFTVNHYLRNHPKLRQAELFQHSIDCSGLSVISRDQIPARAWQPLKTRESLRDGGLLFPWCFGKGDEEQLLGRPTSHHADR